MATLLIYFMFRKDNVIKTVKWDNGELSVGDTVYLSPDAVTKMKSKPSRFSKVNKQHFQMNKQLHLDGDGSFKKITMSFVNSGLIFSERYLIFLILKMFDPKI